MKKNFDSPEYMTIDEFNGRVYAFIDEQADLLVREVRVIRERQKREADIQNSKLVNH